MSDETAVFVIGLAGGLLLALLILGLTVPSRQDFEREAIKAGVATYQLNTNTWEREFVWKGEK